MSNSGIYQIRNTVNGKRYVGSAVSLNRRKNLHFHDLRKGKHHCSHLQNAWNKYGEENFIFEVLEVIEDTSLLLQWEQFYIDYYGRDNLYNTCFTAGSPLGRILSEEHKTKIGIKSLGRTHSEESKKKISTANLGRTRSEEFKTKLRVANLGKVLSEKHKVILRAANLGRACSEETKEKLRIRKVGNTWNRGRKITEATRYKQKIAALNMSSEHKQKISAAKQKAVVRINSETGERVYFSSAKETGVNRSSICSVLHGKRKTAGGFHWEYA